jgi:hypothetical protein
VKKYRNVSPTNCCSRTAACSGPQVNPSKEAKSKGAKTNTRIGGKIPHYFDEPQGKTVSLLKIGITSACLKGSKADCRAEGRQKLTPHGWELFLAF